MERGQKFQKDLLWFHIKARLKNLLEERNVPKSYRGLLQEIEEGIEATLDPKPTTRTYERRLDGKAEAYLVAMVCGAPPEGRGRWTLRLLADHMVGLGYVESVSHETVRQTLKKTV